MQAQIMTKDLIAQHNLTADEHKKIVEIFGCEMICIGMDSWPHVL